MAFTKFGSVTKEDAAYQTTLKDKKRRLKTNGKTSEKEQ